MGSTRKAVVGAFVLGGVLLFAVGLFLIGDRRLLFEPQFELNTEFGTVSGLQVGTIVRVAGLNAGEVLEIRIPSRPSELFLIRMRLREDLRPLVRTDSVASIQTDGIVGSTFVQISRGTDEAPMVEPGLTIAGLDPIQFADLIQEGRDTFRTVTQEILELRADISEAIEPLAGTARAAGELVVEVSNDVRTMTTRATDVAEDVRLLLGDARGVVADVRAGQGTIGQLLTDDRPYQRWLTIADEAGRTMANLRATTDEVRSLTESVASRDGAGQQMMQTLRATLADTREVMSDLSEGAEALKRNFLFRGFFRDRGFFDLDTVSREAYAAGALERNDRTALRVWIEADMLFEPGPDGLEELSADGRRRLESAMADLLRYPRDSPLVVEGYATTTEGGPAFLVAADRAQLVRAFLLSRFRRQTTLTGVMPMSADAPGSPSGDNRWSGVALAMFVGNDALTAGR